MKNQIPNTGPIHEDRDAIPTISIIYNANTNYNLVIKQDEINPQDALSLSLKGSQYEADCNELNIDPDRSYCLKISVEDVFSDSDFRAALSKVLKATKNIETIEMLNTRYKILKIISKEFDEDGLDYLKTLMIDHDLDVKAIDKNLQILEDFLDDNDVKLQDKSFCEYLKSIPCTPSEKFQKLLKTHLKYGDEDIANIDKEDDSEEILNFSKKEESVENALSENESGEESQLELISNSDISSTMPRISISCNEYNDFQMTIIHYIKNPESKNKAYKLLMDDAKDHPNLELPRFLHIDQAKSYSLRLDVEGCPDPNEISQELDVVIKIIPNIVRIEMWFSRYDILRLISEKFDAVGRANDIKDLFIDHDIWCDFEVSDENLEIVEKFLAHHDAKLDVESYHEYFLSVTPKPSLKFQEFLKDRLHFADESIDRLIKDKDCESSHNNNAINDHVEIANQQGEGQLLGNLDQ